MEFRTTDRMQPERQRNERWKNFYTLSTNEKAAQVALRVYAKELAARLGIKLDTSKLKDKDDVIKTVISLKNIYKGID